MPSSIPPADVSEALRAELDGPAFMYPWRLTPELEVPLMGAELHSVHATREELIAPFVTDALDHADATGIDLGAHEGYFAHRLLDWGAQRVVAVDVREINVRRAILLRDHFGIAPQTLEVLEASVYDISPGSLGRFDVALVLGLIYHLENPLGALRVARSLVKPGGLVVVESQLTCQSEPIRHGWGIAHQYETEPASWAARREPLEEQEHQPLAAHGGGLSFIPNRAALVQAMDVIGLEHVEVLEAAAHHNVQYREGDRAVVLGWVVG